MNSHFNEKEARKKCSYMTVVEIRSKHLLELLNRIKELEEALAKKESERSEVSAVQGREQ